MFLNSILQGFKFYSFISRFYGLVRVIFIFLEVCNLRPKYFNNQDILLFFVIHIQFLLQILQLIFKSLRHHLIQSFVLALKFIFGCYLAMEVFLYHLEWVKSYCYQALKESLQCYKFHLILQETEMVINGFYDHFHFILLVTNVPHQT